MRFKQTQVIVLANQKGGCGKTSSTISIAAGFAKLDYTVCIVDTDPQCNATETFGIYPDQLQKEGRFTLADVYLAKKLALEIQIDFGDRFNDKLFLVPGNRGLGSVGSRLESKVKEQIATDENLSSLDEDDIRHEHKIRLKKSIDSLRGIHDVVLIDTPPNLDFLMTTALIAADWFVIPVFPSGYDLDGLTTLVRTVEKVRKRYNPKLRLAGVLLGNYDRSATLDRDIHAALEKRFTPDYVFRTTIGRSVRFRECTVYKQTIFEHDGAQPQAENYLQLVREMINRGAKGEIGQTLNPLPDETALTKVASEPLPEDNVLPEAANG